MVPELEDRARLAVGRLLEGPHRVGRQARVREALGRVWGAVAARRVERPVELPAGLFVVGIGSALLGGAGKTPVAIALARALAAQGVRVTLVGHGYRARPGRPRRVSPADALAEVGDDALLAARELAPSDVPVFVAPTRTAALALAGRSGADVAVVDGLLQARPVRLGAGVLVLDGDAPWGNGACPPAGDLRAPPRALLAAADHVVALTRAGSPAYPGAISLPSAIAGAGELAIDALAPLAVGVVLGVARPARVLASLIAAGISPSAIVRLADHARPSARDLAEMGSHRVDLWVTSARDALKLPEVVAGLPVRALRHDVDVGPLAALVLGAKHP